MNQPPVNVCPLLAIAGIGSGGGPAVCIEDRCAWWGYAGSECVMVTAAIAAREVAENMEKEAANE